MSLHGVARYALETHAPTCVSRIHKTHACMCVRVYACVSRSKRPKRRREERAKWTVGNEFGTFMVCKPSLPSPPPPPSLSLFQRSIERGLRMPRATGGGKTPSFARHPLHRAPQPLSSASFSPRPPPILLRYACNHRAQSDPSTFMTA